MRVEKKAVKRLDRDGKRERETRKIESERCSKGVLKDMYTYQKKKNSEERVSE